MISSFTSVKFSSKEKEVDDWVFVNFFFMNGIVHVQFDKLSCPSNNFYNYQIYHNFNTLLNI